MKKKHKIFGAITLLSTLILGGVICSQIFVKDAFGVVQTKAPASEYKMVLDGTCGITTEENANGLFVRKTKNNNEIEFGTHKSGSIKTSGGFGLFQDANGDFWNKTPISGITKIVVKCSALDYRLEFSSENPLDNWSSSPKYQFASGTLNGNQTYEIPSSQYATYFKFQPLVGGNNWVNSLEIYYTCAERHVHDWQHVDYVPANRGNDGYEEHYECTSCDALLDKDGRETTLEAITLHSTLYTINSGSTQQSISLGTAYSIDQSVIVDIKVLDEGTSGAIYFGFLDGDNSKRTSNIKIYSTGNWEFTDVVGSSLKQGVKLLGKTIDGYYRFNCDLSVMDKEAGFTKATNLLIYKWNHNAGYAEINPEGIEYTRGVYYQGGVDYSTSLTGSKSFTDLIINIDVNFDNGISDTSYLRIMLGDGWSNYYGYFKITKNGIFNDGSTPLDFVSVSTCEDGYTRYSFFAEKLAKTGSPSTFTLFYIHKNSSAKGYFDFSTETHTHNLEKVDAVSPFRGDSGTIEYYQCQNEMCGKMFDVDNNLITADQIIDPSRLKRYESGADANYHFAKQIPVTEAMTIDFKADDPSKKTAFALMQDESWDHYYGYYSFYGDGSPETPYKGVTTAKMLDGYVRITFNLSELNKINDHSDQENTLTGVKWIYVRGGWTGTGGYFDCNVKGGQVVRGTKFNPSTDAEYKFGRKIVETSVVDIDVLWISDATTHFNVCIGDWDNFKGYFEITKNTKTGDFNGLVVTPLDDGYIRYSFSLDKCTKWTQNDKSRSYIDYVHIYIRGAWSTAEGYWDVSYAENLDSPVIGDIY